MNLGVIVVQNAFRVGMLAATLVSLGVTGAGTGFAANSGSAMRAEPQPPAITLLPHGVIHVQAPADGTAWDCKGMSVSPPAYRTARVMKGYVPTGSAMIDSAQAGTSETADLRLPPDTMVLWECDNNDDEDITYKSEGTLQTLP
jgi:hypothetical protein